MPPESKGDLALVWDMVDAGRSVMSFVAGKSLDDFRTDIMLRMTFERGIEIIGEAVRRISPEFQAAHPQIPWRKIATTRHRPTSTTCSTRKSSSRSPSAMFPS